MDASHARTHAHTHRYKKDDGADGDGDGTEEGHEDDTAPPQQEPFAGAGDDTPLVV